MEKPIYPTTTMRITQGYEEGTHKNSYAIDEAGKTTAISKIRAPFTGIIKKIYQNDANEVWLESIDKVEYPDGTIDYMTIMFAHSNDVSNLFVGKRINQYEEFYSEGTKGNSSGNHCHFECGLGKFSGSGWFQNASGFWSINNAKKPEDCLWIDPNMEIIDNHNYNFKLLVPDNIETESPNTSNNLDNTPKPPEQKPEQENKEEQKETKSPQLIFVCPKTDLYGIYLEKDEELYLKKEL